MRPRTSANARWGVAGGERLHRHAVLDRRQQIRALGACRVLRRADAMEPRAGPRRPEELRRVPGRRQMQGDQGRHTGRRQIGGAIDAVQMHEIDGPAPQRRRDRLAVGPPGALPGALVENARLRRHGDQDAGCLRVAPRHDDRAVPRCDEGAVELRQDLLGPADRVRPDRRQRIGDAEDRQGHRTAPRPSSCRAAAASVSQRSPVMPQP